MTGPTDGRTPGADAARDAAKAQRYDRVHEVLSAARGLTGDALDALLDERCRGDDALRREVRQLLVAGRGRADDPFDEGRIGDVRSALESVVQGAEPTWVPERIGEYRVLRPIGRGGMGVVYEAVQASPRRRVALKLIHPLLVTAQRLRRFDHEAQLLGRLRHPGIATIHESGTFDAGRGEQPYVAMELVEGVDIRTHCEREGLSTRERLGLLAEVADAAHAAHQAGVVHRDLKPENVLVDGQGRPRILDFGIARTVGPSATLSTLVTEEGQLVGTLAYMAPEQVTRGDDAVSPRLDVYALGVLGFELVAGRLPYEFDGLSISRTIHVLTTREPARAGAVDPALRGDVEVILGKAMETDRDRRYATAAELADDLRRYLAHQPIRARPPGPLYRARKLVRRHRGLAAGLLVAAVAAALGGGAALRARVDAAARARDLDRAVHRSALADAARALDQGEFAAAEVALGRVPDALRGWEADHLRARLAPHVAAWEFAAPVVSDPVLHPDRERLTTCLADGTLVTFGARDGRVLRSVPVDADLIPAQRRRVLPDPVSGRFAAVGADWDLLVGDLEDGRVDVVLPGSTAPGPAPTLPHDWDAEGERLLYYGAEGLTVWDGRTTRALQPEQVSFAVFDDARDRVLANWVGDLVAFDATTGAVLARGAVDDAGRGLVLSPDASVLAVPGEYRQVFLLDPETLELVARLTGHQAAVASAAWSPCGSAFATSSQDGTLRVWDRATGTATAAYRTGVTEDRGVVALPSGDWALPAGDRLLVFPAEDPHVLRGHETYVYHVAWSPNGSVLATAGFLEPEVHLWDVLRGRELRRLPAPLTTSPRAGDDTDSAARLAFSRDGARLVAWTSHETRHWSVGDGEALPVDGSDDPVERAMATLGRAARPPLPSDAAVSPDGALVALALPDGTVELHASLADGLPDAGGPTRVAVLEGHIGQAYCAAFSPDGARLATGGNDTTIRLWDVATCEPLLVLKGHELYVKDVAFSPDGTMLASASGDHTVRIWDTLPVAERRAQARR